MSKFREKAQGITKETIGQMIGDDLLEKEGREQQQKAHQSTQPDNRNRAGHPLARRERSD